MNQIQDKKSSIYTRPWLILLLVFLVSVGIRIPNIDRPLSTNYEWVTAHTLVTLQIWFDEGITTHRFSPIYTFSNPNDHYIGCPPSGISDSEGNHYYVSYPPFSFILPFLFFKTLNVYPTALALQIFNLFFHFLCSLMVYALICRLLDRRIGNRLFAPAFVAFCVYTFSASALWHHSNVYFADILVQFFFATSTLLLINIYKEKQPAKQSWLLLGGSIFLMTYTEWIGVFFSAVAVIICFFSRKKHRPALSAMLVIMACSGLAVLLTLIQYLSINGLEAFIELAQNRFSERSGHTETVRGNFYALESHLFLVRSYARNYFPHFVIALFLTLPLLIYKKKSSGHISATTKLVLGLTLLPVLLHHVVFFQFTLIHEIALLKTCIAISVVIGLLYFETSSRLQSEKIAAIRAMPGFVVIIMLLLSSYFYYSHIIIPDEYSSQRLGNQIKENASPDETVFFKTTKTLGWALLKAPNDYFVIAPQIHYYAGRCIEVIPDLNAAQEHLRTFNKKKGIVFTIENPQYKIEKVERITAQEDLSLRVDTTDNPIF